MNRLLRCAALMASAFLACAALASPVRAAAGSAGRAECRTIQSKILGRAVPYCALLPPSFDADKSRRYPVLYFFHGLGENEQVLLNAGGFNIVQDLREENQIGEFVIAAPAAGRSVYINSEDGRVRYEDFLLREFFPLIEGRYRIEPGRRERGVTGVSMGGYGALHIALHHPELFGSVSSHSGALVEKLPPMKSSDPQLDVLAQMAGTAFGDPFNREFWERNNPFTMIRNGLRPEGLKIYFDCGTEDQFGFNFGAQAFHNLLVAHKIPHEFHLYPGGHDWGYFAEHFPASLQFHSRAFGLGGLGNNSSR